MHEKTEQQILTDSLDNEDERERERNQIISKVSISNTGQFFSAKAQMKISL